jgi:hypothetical protein
VLPRLPAPAVVATPTPTASRTSTQTGSASITASVSVTPSPPPPSISASPSATLSAGASVSSTASNTPSPSTTASSSRTGTGTRTGTPSVTPTATITSSATATLTSMGGPVPSSAFVLVTIGSGSSVVPNTGKDLTVPVTVSVYGDCLDSTSCFAPTLDRSIALWASNVNGGYDRYNNKLFSLNSGSVGCPSAQTCRSTYRQGRVVPSGTGGSVIVAGYDVASGYDFASGKREPTTFEFYYTGRYNVTTP